MNEASAAAQSTITTAELRAVLEDGLSSRFGNKRKVRRIERRPSAYRSSFVLDEVNAELDDETVLPLVLKDLSPEAFLRNSHGAKPAFLYDPVREIATYTRILEAAHLGTAACYAAVAAPAEERFYLLLERVAGVMLSEVGDFAIWQRTARWLASLHTQCARSAKAFARAAPLLQYDHEYYRLWPRRLNEFASNRPAPPYAPVLLEKLAGCYGRAVEHLAALPVTFLHGEFYPANVLVQTQATECRICPVDWEMAAIGPGLIDLAALTAGKWTEEERTGMAMAYQAALAPGGYWSATPEGLLVSLDFCRLHLAVQWLGWSPTWSPPPEHAHDWWSEARSLLDRLGL